MFFRHRKRPGDLFGKAGIKDLVSIKQGKAIQPSLLVRYETAYQA